MMGEVCDEKKTLGENRSGDKRQRTGRYFKPLAPSAFG
jgi:hypothetical protein